jgi:hypothetical protein
VIELTEVPILATAALVAAAAAEAAEALALPPVINAQYPPASLAQTVTRQM